MRAPESVNLGDDAGFERGIGQLLHGGEVAAARLNGFASISDAADVHDVEVRLPTDDADVAAATRGKSERADLVRTEVRCRDAAECGLEAIEVLHFRAEDFL